MLDLIIRNGRLADGTGGPIVPADLAIEGGRIVAIGALDGGEARETIDARGQVVAPGFIDMHSHADRTLPVLPTSDSLVRQGITTVVVGQCGASPVPLLPESRETVIARASSDDLPLPWERWDTFGSYLSYLREEGISINAVPLVGQGMIREGVMGYTANPPTPDQLARMADQVIQAMDEGAIGLSTGLIYPVSSYASTEEIIELVRPVGARGGYYFSHIRNEGDELFEALAEAIRIGEETGAVVQIAHFKAAGRDNWHKAEKALAMVDRARARGVNVSADMYPYTAGSSSLKSVLPEWAQEGGVEATLERLADADTRARMSASMQGEGFFRIVEWDRVLISSSPRNRAYEGRTVADLAEAVGVGAHQWVFDALIETGLQMSMVSFISHEPNLDVQLRRPWMMIGTDAAGAAVSGPLSVGKPHPRTYGTFARVLGRFCREKGVLSLEEALYRMTGLAARKLGWSDRGTLAKGLAADVVVFDPQTVRDVATYQEPHQYAVGISHVIVNGRVVVREGEHTGARPGMVLGARQ